MIGVEEGGRAEFRGKGEKMFQNPRKESSQRLQLVHRWGGRKRRGKEISVPRDPLGQEPTKQLPTY